MNAESTSELSRDATASADGTRMLMEVTVAESLILRWFRGDKFVTPAMLESALALGKATAKPVVP